MFVCEGDEGGDDEMEEEEEVEALVATVGDGSNGRVNRRRYFKSDKTHNSVNDDEIRGGSTNSINKGNNEP